LKLRSLTLLAAIAATLAPAASHAEDVCDSPIAIFSRFRVAETGIPDPRNPDNTLLTAPSATSSAVGCTVVRDTVQPGAGFEYFYDTNLIYPGSNRIEVRLFENGRDPSVLSEATVKIGEDVHELEMLPGVDVSGTVSPWLDSVPIDIDPTITLGPLLVSAHFCIDAGDADDFCYDITYRTAPLQPLPV
jgi:hypothetical protein